jgi:hypothetical protein
MKAAMRYSVERTSTMNTRGRHSASPVSPVTRKGFIPDTFVGLESVQIAFAHIDVDIYKSIMDSLKFIWPRLSFGGFIVLDDYGFPTCPGARASVDEFFQREPCAPLCLPTGQALVFKGVTSEVGRQCGRQSSQTELRR